MSKELSVIIVNWNGEKILNECLKSFFKYYSKYTDKDIWELIIVDNNSEDNSIELIDHYYPQSVLICNEENLGFSKAVNIGIKRSTGKYILLLNNDTIIHDPLLIPNGINHLDADNTIGILGVKVVYPNGKIQTTGEKFSNFWNVFKTQVLFWKFVQSSFNYANGNKGNNLVEVDYVCGACAFINRKVVGNVGYFNEDYFMYGEDLEFCYRAKLSNWKVMVALDLEVIHLHSVSSEKNIKQMTLHSINNGINNSRIIYGEWQSRWVKFAYILGVIIRFFISVFRKNRASSDYYFVLKKLILKN